MVIIHRYLFSIFQSVCVTVSIKAEALHNEKKHGDFFFILGAINSLHESLRFKVFRKKKLRAVRKIIKKSILVLNYIFPPQVLAYHEL